MKTKRLIYRRQFIRSLIALFCSVGLPVVGASLKLLSEAKSMAKRLEYHHDGDSVPASKRKDKTAYCRNCLYYRKTGQIEGEEVGSCNMLTGGMVKASGWCTSWMKHPAAK